MFEKHEKWFVLAIIALAIWYFYKKGKAGLGMQAQAQQARIGEQDFFTQTMVPATGSLVNPASEIYTARPAQTTTPVLYKPAQPSAPPISQLVSAGQFNWVPVTPVLRSSYSGTGTRLQLA